MENLLFALRHPIRVWRHYRAMRRFEKLFGKFGPAPF